MSWQATLHKASFDTQKIKGGGVGFKIIMALDGGNVNSIIESIKNEELNLGGVRSSLNKIIRLFNQINEQANDKTIPENKWLKMKEQYEDVTFAATATDVPIPKRMMENAEKLKEKLDDYAPAKMSGGKRNPNYKDKIPKKVLKLYEEFLGGNFQPLVDYLNEGSQEAKKTKIKQLRLWEKNNSRFVKALKSAKANKSKLMGYDTKDVKLLLPDDFNFGIIPKAWTQEEQADGVLVSLPDWITILQGKKLSGGDPDKPIVRNFFAKVFNQPKYSKKKIAGGMKNIKAESFQDDNVALRYLQHVLTKVSGADRGAFIPVLSPTGDSGVGAAKETAKILFGVQTGSEKGTGKVLPALEYLFEHKELDISAGFVANRTKSSLTRDAVYRKLSKGEGEESVLRLFNKYVKADDARGFAKFELAMRGESQETKDAYERMQKETPLIPSGISVEMRDFLLKPPVGGWGKVPQLKIQYPSIEESLPSRSSIRNMKFGEHRYGDSGQPDDEKRVKQIKDALSKMKPSKQDNSILVPSSKSEERLLSFLFSAIDHNPIENFKQQFAADQKQGGTFRVRLKAGQDTNKLSFYYLVGVLDRLEAQMLGSNKINKAVRKITRVKRVYNDETGQWEEGTPPTPEEMSKLEKAFEDAVNDVYPQIRNGLVEATKKKMAEVVSEPIIIDKEGVAQPRDWLRELTGVG